jgi:hypothetical protein
MKRTILLVLFFCAGGLKNYAQIFSVQQSANTYSVSDAAIYVDSNDAALVKKSAKILQQDIERVTGKFIPISYNRTFNHKAIIVIGSVAQSSLIRQLAEQNKIKVSSLKDKWEAYQIQSLSNPFKNVAQALVITGSDRRGTAYAVFECSKQLGVSPWYWWADVPVVKKSKVFIKQNVFITDAPKVKYRGIFINDEAPALSNWSKEKFGGFNHKFYENVFELILRLKGNYLWPAMWGNAFYYDDSLNIKSADEFGIVIGTSHHEPLMRAHEEWKYFGQGRKWNYDSTEAGLKEYWKGGMQRATNEKIVSVGMRGDGDEPMSRETATSLLERIVKDQRQIIEEVTGKPASETPQLWALYKEVQDYYDKGMRVPDDITLLLCDDNWGDIRRLPKLNEKSRKGGYGIYYHFDYVGGPRNYKWLNTNPIARIREQMNLAWEYNARQIWIVNVGDIKPMEFPISFFLDYAWNPEQIGAADLQKYTEQWSAAQFGKKYAKEISDIISAYSKFNARRKPELLDANTYSLNFDEWATVVSDYNKLLKRAEEINKLLSAEYRDAYFQLVLHPVKACANLNNMYYHVALNKDAYKNKWREANTYADKVKELYIRDSLISMEYHQLNNGKWNHMMDQTHIGYTYWQQPNRQKIPIVSYVPDDSVKVKIDTTKTARSKAPVPAGLKGNTFYQDEANGVSIEAHHFSRAINANGISWKVLPDLGRTGSAITTIPVTAKEQVPSSNTPHVEYDFYTYSQGDVIINAYFSPTLNFQNAVNGLQFAISVDDETPQILSINKDDAPTNTGIWNKWVAENIIIIPSKHTLSGPGKHKLKYWMVSSGVVLQKIVVDFGGMKQSYLGPPETIVK